MDALSHPPGLRETSSSIELPGRFRADRKSILPPSIGAQSRTNFESVLKNLGPDELRSAAASLPLHDFLALYGETLLLLVSVGPKDQELEAGLRVTAVRDQASVAVEPVPGSMWSRTQSQDAFERMGAYAGRGADREADFLQRLANGRHFAVPLRKRVTAEPSAATQISVGRAPSKDIVLRHGSVSKAHSSFEMDEDGVFYVVDGGSKNGTWVNSRQVSSTSLAIKPGDVLRFGAVEAAVCSPRTMWSLLALANKRGR